MISAKEAREQVTSLKNKIVEEWLKDADKKIAQAAAIMQTCVTMPYKSKELFDTVKAYLEDPTLGYKVTASTGGCGGSEINISW